jgi:hypothetical protein
MLPLAKAARRSVGGALQRTASGRVSAVTAGVRVPRDQFG